ncbi:MAG: DMT family transporter [Deltaproteobacteria bacterium]|nr:DMT family transporter [Deltaproteobacteria bacterium]
MGPEIIALLSAMGWAGDAILVRLGARTSNIFAAAFMSYFVSALCIWVYLVGGSRLQSLGSPATIYFVLSGCFQPLLARLLYYTAITRLGVSRAAPLRAISPLFALILAVIFLRERPAPIVYAGTALIVAAVWMISWTQSGERQWKLLDILFPVGAALVAAVSQNLRRGGLLIVSDPVAGAAVSTMTSLVLYFISLLVTGKLYLVRPEKGSFPFFMAAACIATFAQLLNYIALNLGQVSLMAPLLDSTPLFSVLFSRLFLKDLEKVTPRVVLGAVLMVAGIAIIASR